MKPLIAIAAAVIVFGCASRQPAGPEPGAAAAPGFAIHPLSAPVRTRDLAAFRTIGELANYLSTRAGYAVAIAPPAPAEAAALADWPPNPRIFTREVLPAEAVLAGALYPDGQLIVDTVNRLVSFRRADAPAAHSNPFAFPLTGEYLRLIP